MNLIVSARTQLALAMLAGLGLAGCSSQPKFACPALTTGYGCQSMLEVYERTDAPGVSDARQPTDAEQKKSRRAAKRESAAQVRATENAHALAVDGDSLALAAPVQFDSGAVVGTRALSLGGTGHAVLPSPEADAVARLPAQVMRIWFAPWTDVRGDLHRPSYVYTEVAGRRWAIGGDVRAVHDAATSFDPNGPMFPLSVP